MAASIKKVAVIGAGVMGAGIAAHCANAGVEVVLLDIVPKGADKKGRSAIAEGALAKLLKTKPAPLMHKSFAKRITTGNIEDDLALLSTCDWVIEAVIERLDIKQNLYRTIAPHLKRGAIISSNTSTIPLEQLVEGMPKGFVSHFLITHFFNPPRYMRLLEIVTSSATLATVIKRITEFADVHLGKTVIPCNDTPGFIANRIGTYWLHAAVVKALEHNIDPVTADAVLGRPAGVPKTGVFALLDLVGLDLMPHVLDSMQNALPPEDAFNALGPAPKILDEMITKGYTGRKGGGGFYRLNAQRKKEAIDLATLTYAPAGKANLPVLKKVKKKGLRVLLDDDSAAGRYAWEVIGGMLAYAASLLGEVSDDMYAIDRAMELGFNWKFGPFALIDKLGVAWFVRKCKATGIPVPKLFMNNADTKLYVVKNGQLGYLQLNGKYRTLKRPDGVLLLQDIKRKSKPVAKNISASLWDIGQGVLCYELHSKGNTFDPFGLSMLNKAYKLVKRDKYKGLVVYNEGANFSLGANILMLKIGADLKLFPLIRWILAAGQRSFQRLKFAPFPVVGAPANMALGGGCEILLHCRSLTPHAEFYVGLVEAGVGIIPGWGGCKELLGRASTAPSMPKGPMPAVSFAFETIATAKVATSAYEARDLLFVRPTDNIVMNRDRVLFAARAEVLRQLKGYHAPAPYSYQLPGESGATALQLALNDFRNKGLATPHDIVVGGVLAKTLTGGTTDYLDILWEKDILKLERDGIVALCKTKGTRDRITHMITKNKPLRN